jgi:hypothetical protein
VKTRLVLIQHAPTDAGARLCARQEAGRVRQACKRVFVLGHSPRNADSTGRHSRRNDRWTDLQARLRLHSGSDETSVDVEKLSCVGVSPAVTLKQLSGSVSIEDGNLILRDITVQRGESSFVFGVTNRRLPESAGTPSLPTIAVDSDDFEIVGKGTLSYATKIVAQDDVVELENFATQPVMLTEIRSYKPND